jgi:hypothetical protein
VIVTGLLWSGGEEDAVVEQVEPGVAVHLALEDLNRLTLPSTAPELHWR